MFSLLGSQVCETGVEDNKTLDRALPAALADDGSLTHSPKRVLF
jgi:hypothetical protein